MLKNSGGKAVILTYGAYHTTTSTNGKPEEKVLERWKKYEILKKNS